MYYVNERLDFGENKFVGQFKDHKEKIVLDLIDTKIMYLLSKNCRFAENSIAKSLGISKEVVNYRIKRLQKQDFLHGFLTVIDPNKLGKKVFVVLLSLYPHINLEHLITKLNLFPSVTHISHRSAPFDLWFRVTTKNSHEFMQFFEDFMSIYHLEIKYYEIATILYDIYLGMDFLIPDKDKRPTIIEGKGSSFNKILHYSSIPDAVSLDEKDQHILKLLEHNARLPLLQIAKEINLAPTSIKNRLQNMVEKGVINSFIPYASFSYLGYQWYVLMLRTKILNEIKFIEFLHEHPNIVWMVKQLGKWNYVLSIFAKNSTELNIIINDLRSQFSNSINAMETAFVFNQNKFEQGIGERR